MSLVEIEIYVEDLTNIMVNFDKIQIHRAETQYGVYSEITVPLTRPTLVAGTYNYGYTDNSGSEFFWYKWCFYNSTTLAVSRFYGPIQGYTPGVTYTDLDSVKRELRTNRVKGRLRLSDSFRNLRSGKNNTGTIKLGAISINPDYFGEERFTIKFTSVTDYDVTVTDEKTVEPRFLGSGDTTTDFEANDYSFRIYNTDWTGAAVVDDIIEFQTDSHMSVNDAIKFIKDSEIFVDMLIEENIGFTTENRSTLIFTRDDVPKTVRVATTKFAAFFIYSAVYNEQSMPGLPTSINDITLGNRRDNDISYWPQQGMRLMEGFIKKYSTFFDIESGTPSTTSPRWMATESLFDATGVAYVGDGLKLPDLDQFKEAAYMTYDNLLDWDLLTPYVNEVGIDEI